MRTPYNAPSTLLAALCCVGLLASSCGSGQSSAEGTTLEDLSSYPLADADGGDVNLNDWSGRPLVINYFAGWCAPCRGEIPAFSQTADAYAPDVAIVGISRDTDTDTWRSFVAETGASFPTFYEGQGEGTFEAVGALGMPTTVFVSADGQVVDVHSGPLTADDLENKIQEELLNG